MKLTTYVKSELDGSIVTVSFTKNDGDSWWTPTVRRDSGSRGGVLVLLGPVQCNSPYDQPERFLERL